MTSPVSSNSPATNVGEQTAPEQGATTNIPLDRDDLLTQVTQVTSFLEALRDDYEALALLPLAAKQRLLMAAGQLARPGPWAKRALAQAARERHEAKRRQQDTALLDQTGIRQSRRQTVFTPWQHGAVIDHNDGSITPHLLNAAAATFSETSTKRISQNAHSSASITDAPKLSLGSLHEARNCYSCKSEYREVHFFYDGLCPSCATFNWLKRTPTADLAGRVAVITGARVKIGYHAALMLLRAGARVVVTTRFPRDAAKRYAAEEDFLAWRDRLEVFGLDLRHTPSVETFTRFLCQHLPRLDFIINNACQTVRRPVGFYDHLIAGEEGTFAQLGNDVAPLVAAYERMRGAHLPARHGHGALVAAADAVGLRDPAALSQLALLEEDLDRSTHLFPRGQLDADLQQIDLRAVNSWRLPLAKVSAVELLEVQLVNAVAPFIINARLKALMLTTPNRDKHIVNVSAVEGQFSRRLKTDKHPHTNMAKAALNMMTRTSAADYLRAGIHMNSVDTGWVTDEDPAAIAARKTQQHGFHPPLDIVDGAARIVDPIFTGINTGKHVWGAFLKDYRPVDW